MKSKYLVLGGILYMDTIVPYVSDFLKEIKFTVYTH